MVDSNLCGELVTEWSRRSQVSEDTNNLEPLVSDIVKYHMTHSAGEYNSFLPSNNEHLAFVACPT